MTTPPANPPTSGTDDLDLWGAWALVYTFIAGIIGITPDTRAEHTVHAELAIHGLPRTEADAWALLDRLFDASHRIGWPDHLKATLLGVGLEEIYASGPGLDDPRYDDQLRPVNDEPCVCPTDFICLAAEHDDDDRLVCGNCWPEDCDCPDLPDDAA
ncbi:hypothetical protein [Blastococcus mobilis]|nr:hypothetical protein [Blastococcus mobilis]